MSTSVRQALRILELLAPHPEGVRVSDLAESLATNRAIPHKLLGVLTELGYVTQNPMTERYHATFRLGALGLQQVENAGVSTWAEGPLDALARETEELVRMAVESNGTLQWVAKAQGSNSSLIIDPASGASAVLHATATGKAWLSTLADDALQRYLAATDLDPQTPRTITDRELLLAELSEAANRGYALVEEEMDLGISAIAAPIFVQVPGEGRSAVGTVSIAGPAARLTAERLRAFAPALLTTADTLSTYWPVYLAHSDRSAGPG
jgi:DNA-binding IclR family transcriptional regulator